MRKLFRAAGCDPTRYRPASEALLRRLVKGAELPPIHPLVDVNNCLSAELAVPCCVMKEGSLGTSLVFRSGAAGESYESLRGPFNAEAKPLLVDEIGPIDTPITGSERVKVQTRYRKGLAGGLSAEGMWSRLMTRGMPSRPLLAKQASRSIRFQKQLTAGGLTSPRPAVHHDPVKSAARQTMLLIGGHVVGVARGLAVDSPHPRRQCRSPGGARLFGLRLVVADHPSAQSGRLLSPHACLACLAGSTVADAPGIAEVDRRGDRWIDGCRQVLGSPRAAPFPTSPVARSTRDLLNRNRIPTDFGQTGEGT